MGQKSSTMKLLGVKKWTKERDEWLQTVSREQVLQDLTDLYSRGNFDKGPAYSSAELTQLTTTADNFAGSVHGYVTELLKDQHGDRVDTLEPIVEILIKIWNHHAAYPFLPKSSAGLDSNGFLRAVTLLSGKAYKSVGSGSKMDGQVLTRKKNDSDSRRMLFRSLAVPVPDHTARDIENQESKQEILDILTCIQPRLTASTAQLPRQQLEPTANRLCEQEVLLPSLVIRLEDMRNLLGFLSASRFGFLSMAEVHELAKSTHYTLNSFLLGRNDGVRWDAFDKVIEHIMPRLALGLQGLIAATYAPKSHILFPSPATSGPNRLYSIALPQLLTFLPKYVYPKLYNSQTILEHSVFSPHPSEKPLQGLLDRLHEQPGPLIFLVSAVIGEETSVFGAFVPTTVHLDAPAIMSTESARLLGNSLLFQLAPMQDVFPVRCNGAGLPLQAFHDVKTGENGGLSFGQPKAADATSEGGVTLQIRGKHLEKGIFVHSMSKKGVYTPSAALGERRGDINLEFDVREIEVVAL
ncbi:MAG: hypothetical protein Q9171_003280 [Xanthocarpia ochracea]